MARKPPVRKAAFILALYSMRETIVALFASLRSQEHLVCERCDPVLQSVDVNLLMSIFLILSIACSTRPARPGSVPERHRGNAGGMICQETAH